MIQVGRWVVSILFALVGLAALLMGAANLAGWMTPQTEGMEVPAGQEHIFVTAVGVGRIIAGLAFVLAAWAIYRWRSWGRILAIVLCVLQLFGLVVLSFRARLDIISIAVGVVAAAILIWLFNSGVQVAFATGGKQA